MDRHVHSVAALLLFCGAASAQNADPAEMVRQGWTAIDAKEWEGAEFLFRAALKDAADSADGHVGLGVAFARQNNYDRALPELEKGRELGSKYEHLDLEMGRALYMNKRYADALPPIDAYSRSHPDVWQTYEILGLCCFQTKAFAKCIEAFAHPSLKSHTEHEAMYLFYTGASQLYLGREAWRGVLEGIVQKHPRSPYAESATKLLAAAAKGPVAETHADHDVWSRARRLRPERWWYVFGAIEGGHDTNPVSIGHDALVDGSLANQPSWFLQLQGGVGARIVNRERTYWGVEARHLTNWHDELSKFDVNQFSASTYFEQWLNDWLGFGLTGSFSPLWVGGEETRDTWSAGPSAYLVEAYWTRTRVYFDFQNHEYTLDGVTVAGDPDSSVRTVGVSQEAYVPGSELRLALGYSHSAQHADGNDYDADFDRFSLLAAHPVAWKIRATATFAYSHGSYHHDNGRDSGRDDRDDDTFTYGIRLDRPVTDWMSAYMGAAWIDGESNLGVFDYDRNLYTAGVEFRY